MIAPFLLHGFVEGAPARRVFQTLRDDRAACDGAAPCPCWCSDSVCDVCSSPRPLLPLVAPHCSLPCCAARRRIASVVAPPAVRARPMSQLSAMASMWQMAIVAMALLLCAGGPSPALAQSPTLPYPPWGLQPSSAYWPALSGGAVKAEANPLNKAGLSTTACTNTMMNLRYDFSVLENYQQPVTFFPAACNNLVVQINDIPRSHSEATQETKRQGGAESGRTRALLGSPLTCVWCCVLFCAMVVRLRACCISTSTVYVPIPSRVSRST